MAHRLQHCPHCGKFEHEERGKLAALRKEHETLTEAVTELLQRVGGYPPHARHLTRVRELLANGTGQLPLLSAAALGGRDTLSTRDVQELHDAALKLQAAMSDGEWRTRAEIQAITGQVEGLRRLRELRAVGIVEKEQIPGETRTWKYRFKPYKNAVNA